jgi:transcriptional regulator with XRE-family HTH domain
MNQEKVGQRIQRLRAESGISQDELADRVGISLDSLIGMESEKIRPFGPFLEHIAEVLQVKPEHILSGNDGFPDEIAEFAETKFRGNPDLIKAFENFARDASFRNKNLTPNELEFLLEQFLSEP